MGKLVSPYDGATLRARDADALLAAIDALPGLACGLRGGRRTELRREGVAAPAWQGEGLPSSESDRDPSQEDGGHATPPGGMRRRPQ